MHLGYVLLYVDDVVRAVEFYELAFGQRRKFVHESGDYAELHSGGTALGFVSQRLAQENGVPFAAVSPELLAPGIEVGFVVEDVVEAYDRAVAAGAAPVLSPQRKPWGQTVSYVRDCHGFLVELCTPLAQSTEQPPA